MADSDITITLAVDDRGSATIKNVETAVDRFAQQTAQAAASGMKPFVDQLGAMQKAEVQMGQVLQQLTASEARYQATVRTSAAVQQQLNASVAAGTKTMADAGAGAATLSSQLGKISGVSGVKGITDQFQRLGQATKDNVEASARLAAAKAREAELLKQDTAAVGKYQASLDQLNAATGRAAAVTTGTLTAGLTASGKSMAEATANAGRLATAVATLQRSETQAGQTLTARAADEQKRQAALKATTGLQQQLTATLTAGNKTLADSAAGAATLSAQLGKISGAAGLKGISDQYEKLNRTTKDNLDSATKFTAAQVRETETLKQTTAQAAKYTETTAQTLAATVEAQKAVLDQTAALGQLATAGIKPATDEWTRYQAKLDEAQKAAERVSQAKGKTAQAAESLRKTEQQLGQTFQQVSGQVAGTGRALDDLTAKQARQQGAGIKGQIEQLRALGDAQAFTVKGTDAYNKIEQQKQAILERGRAIQNALNTALNQGKITTDQYAAATRGLGPIFRANQEQAQGLAERALSIGKAFISSKLAAVASLAAILELAKNAADKFNAFTVLSGTFRTLAQNQQYTNEQMKVAIDLFNRYTGSTKVSTEVLGRLLEADIKLADAVQLANVAEVVAIKNQLSYKDAALRLADAIEFKRVREFKSLGLVLDLEKAEKDLEKQLGRTAAQFTDSEERLVFLRAAVEAANKVSIDGAKITDNYRFQLEELGRNVRSTGSSLGEYANKGLAETLKITNLSVGATKNLGITLGGVVKDILAGRSATESLRERFKAMGDETNRQRDFLEGKLTPSTKDLKKATDQLANSYVSQAEKTKILQGLNENQVLIKQKLLDLDKQQAEAAGNALAAQVALSLRRTELERRSAEISKDIRQKNEQILTKISQTGILQRAKLTEEAAREAAKAELETRKAVAAAQPGGALRSQRIAAVIEEAEVAKQQLDKQLGDAKQFAEALKALHLAGETETARQLVEIRGRLQAQKIALDEKAAAEADRIRREERLKEIENQKAILDLRKEAAEAKPGGATLDEKKRFQQEENRLNLAALQERFITGKQFEEKVVEATLKGDTELLAELFEQNRQFQQRKKAETLKAEAEITKATRDEAEKRLELEFTIQEERLKMLRDLGPVQKALNEEAQKRNELDRRYNQLVKELNPKTQAAEIDELTAAYQRQEEELRVLTQLDIAKSYGEASEQLKNYIENLDHLNLSGEAVKALFEEQAEVQAKVRESIKQLNEEFAAGEISIYEYMAAMQQLQKNTDPLAEATDNVTAALYRLTGSLKVAQAGGALFNTTAKGIAAGVGAAYDAMLRGENAAKAFKKMVADVIAADGKEAAVKAIKETAAGFAALAVHDYEGATLHFKSAATYAAVGAIAGAAGAALGAGQGAGGSGGSSTGPSQQEQRPQVIDLLQGPLTSPARQEIVELRAAINDLRDTVGKMAETNEAAAAAHAAAINQLSDTVDSIRTMPPGVVVKSGIDENSAAVAVAIGRVNVSDWGVGREIAKTVLRTT